jgi:hypothetical protein
MLDDTVTRLGVAVNALLPVGEYSWRLHRVTSSLSIVSIIYIDISSLKSYDHHPPQWVMIETVQLRSYLTLSHRYQRG